MCDEWLLSNPISSMKSLTLHNHRDWEISYRKWNDGESWAIEWINGKSSINQIKHRIFSSSSQKKQILIGIYKGYL